MSEVRRDILSDTWVIVLTESTEVPLDHRTQRKPPPVCPFDAGNESQTPSEVFAIRSDHTLPNQPGWQVRVVPNKNPVLRIEGNLIREGVGIHDKVSGVGANEVIIETPEHITTLHSLSAQQISLVFRTYRTRILDLYKDKRFRYVMVFKDYGALAGASTIEHSHSQLIALPATPQQIKSELAGAKAYFEYKERCIFCDVIANELEDQSRVILETNYFVVLAPYASRFPFELLIFPKRHAFSYEIMNPEEIADIGEVMKRTMKALYETLFDPPYNYVLHTSPNLLPQHGYWSTIRDDFHWHLEIIPRVKRTDGFEWGSGFFINPVAPERVASKLKEKL
jgi:UDPglucose--hexose-1-phosphate uridylyltransferase